MITIAQLSDLHLFYRSTRRETSQGLNVREADGYLAFAQVVTDIIAVKPTCVLVCGDTFHVPTPGTNAIVFAQNQFRRFAKAGIPVYILAGNHDVTDVKADIAASRVLHDPARRIFSFVSPYERVEVAPGVHFHMISHHMYNDQEATMASVKPVAGEVNILSTHGSIIDPLLKIKLHTEQSPREVVIPDHLLNDFEWNGILLGHIHERGFAGSRDGVADTLGKKVFYNGSLLRRGFSDKECPLGRGWTLWTVDEKGLMTPEFHKVAQRPQFDFPVIDAQKLTAQEVSDLIVERLRETQPEEGPVFKVESAPLVRQKIKNIAPAKRAALDWATIDQEKGHTLLWQCPPASPDEVVQETEEKLTSVALEDYVATTDMVNLYDNWISSSQALEKAHEERRTIIKEQARKFVELGQEVSLDE